MLARSLILLNKEADSMEISLMNKRRNSNSSSIKCGASMMKFVLKRPNWKLTIVKTAN